MSKRPYFDKARASLDEAHKACFNHPDRDVLGMSYGPFSGVNQALGIIAELEEYKRSVGQYLSAGYRILAPGEMDRETLEAAAKVAADYCWNRYRAGGVLKSPAVFNSHTRDDIAAAIRALGGGEG